MNVLWFVFVHFLNRSLTLSLSQSFNVLSFGSVGSGAEARCLGFGVGFGRGPGPQGGPQGGPQAQAGSQVQGFAQGISEIFIHGVVLGMGNLLGKSFDGV